jgi:hypothetical protein
VVVTADDIRVYVGVVSSLVGVVGGEPYWWKAQAASAGVMSGG